MSTHLKLNFSAHQQFGGFFNSNLFAPIRRLANAVAFVFMAVALLLTASSTLAATLNFSSNTVTIAGTPTGGVQFFEFDIELVAFPTIGSNANPGILTVDYEVNGSLDPGNPSGFPGFALKSEDINGGVNPLTGTQFYSSGASLNFIVSAAADLSDGLQLNELDLLPGQSFPSPVDAANAVFILNAREDGTGRYHPPLLILRNDGTGQILNSNNTGVNGQTGRDIVAQDGLSFGDEYITNFTFDPGQLTLVAPVPAPAALVLFASSIFGFVGIRVRSNNLKNNR